MNFHSVVCSSGVVVIVIIYTTKYIYLPIVAILVYSM